MTIFCSTSQYGLFYRKSNSLSIAITQSGVGRMFFNVQHTFGNSNLTQVQNKKSEYINVGG